MNQEKRPNRDSTRHQAVVYTPAILLALIAFVVAYQFIQPAPPRHVVMTTGSPNGAYHAFAKRYAEVLAREGITLELHNSAGTMENLVRLNTGEASVALVQGSVAGPSEGMSSLGSVFREPVWLLHRLPEPVTRLKQLADARVAFGGYGSGTLALVVQWLGANAMQPGPRWQAMTGSEAAAALKVGEIDAAFFVASADSPILRDLLKESAIKIARFERTAAYSSRFNDLQEVVLPEGVIDLAANLPDRDTRLLAATANLVVRDDLHPAINDLLLQAAEEVHAPGSMLEDRNEFPAPTGLTHPLNASAERYYKHGPPLLQRYMPFWAASLVDRLKVMLLPLLLFLFPLFKIMPPIYTWRMRARVYRWYDALEKVEERAESGEAFEQLRAELDALEKEIAAVNVPLSFTDRLYHLRTHVQLVRSRLEP